MGPRRRILGIFAGLTALTLPLIAQHPVILTPQSSWHHPPANNRADALHSYPKVALVLSGGGARGLAQIGVLRAFEHHRIPIDLIVGNSLGSVVGALYASGYSIAAIESIATHTNWTELLSFSEETKRTDLFLEQKEMAEQGFLQIRFEGLEPIIPSSISGGQRLSNFFTYLTLQALYHPNPSFDGLKYRYRATATDLITGKRIILDRGSLAEALRASVTIPLLYSPLEYDSMYLVDGGLTSNIPVDVARSLGSDLVIAVNSTSGMRSAGQMTAPWEIADQIMTIMMQEGNRRELSLADVVITPEGGRRIATDFTGIDMLIRAGETAGERAAPMILARLKTVRDSLLSVSERTDRAVRAVSGLDALPPATRAEVERQVRKGEFTLRSAQDLIDALDATHEYAENSAEVVSTDSSLTISLRLRRTPILSGIQFSGDHLVSHDAILACLSSLDHRPYSADTVQKAFENIISLYRRSGYSLARIDSTSLDTSAGILHFHIDEGIISRIRYEGNAQTRDYILRRELPIEEGDVFDIDRISRGVVNIRSTDLFDYVLLDVHYEDNKAVVIVKVKEKSPELMRMALHVDNEHSFVATVDFRYANMRGAWENLGLAGRYGYRDRSAEVGYTINRIFNTYLKFNVRAYAGSRDIPVYTDDFSGGTPSWDRIEIGRYRRELYGWSAAFGSHFERFGDVTAQYQLERHSLSGLSGTGYTPEQYRFASIRLKSTIDTKNKFLFPTSGIYFELQYEAASRNLGSEIGFGKLYAVYESYLTPSAGHTLRPRFAFGYADRTLPLFEQFSLGGMSSFYGLHEDDSYGRQLFQASLEYRYRLPFKMVFDTYFKLRYDLASISLAPEELKLRSFRQALGAELALDTPLGEASVGLGQSFYIRQDLPNTPLGFGPLLVYFSIGPPL